MFRLPYPPCDPSDTSSFAYETVLKRWPAIITGVVNDVYHLNHVLTLQHQPDENNGDLQEKIEEGKRIIGNLSLLKYRMARDQEMEAIQDDGGAAVEIYNAELARLATDGKDTWFKAPWLFAECYLYRLFRSYFALTEHWRNHDPFIAQKVDTFRQSESAVYNIATTMHELETGKHLYEQEPEKIGVLFKEMIQMCLWGNATDLSLLTQLSPEDLVHLQSVGRDAQTERKKFILRDDQDAVWEHVKALKGGRVDFVIDNAGFELFTDLVFADFLVTHTPFVSKVVFHPKLIPWFVSDTTPADFAAAIPCLLENTFFGTPPLSPASKTHLSALATRLQSHLTDGTFSLSVPPETPYGMDDEMANFWTEPWPYWAMEYRARHLWEWLCGSDLVIFKGDLNYRKLTGDLKWPASTSFAKALGPLAGSFPILSLRTNKADVVVGVDQEVADKLDQSNEKWRWNGRYALISYLAKKQSLDRRV